jgi:hypothetical protein
MGRRGHRLSHDDKEASKKEVVEIRNSLGGDLPPVNT